MRFTKHDINKLDYIKILTRKANGIAYLNDNKDCYIDLSSNSIKSYHNRRVYKIKNTVKICSFNDILSKYDLWLLLLDANGNLRNDIIEPLATEILYLFNNISTLNNDFIHDMNNTINDVVELCIKNLDINDENYIKLFKSYIFIEMMINGEGKRTLIMKKENNLLDYKIIRLLKYLKIDINIKNIPNFKIEYNLEKIKYYDENNNLTETKGLVDREKVKILI